LLYVSNVLYLHFQTTNLIHQSELRTKVVPFKEKKFLSLCTIVKTIESNRIIKIDNWSKIYWDYFKPKCYGFICHLIIKNAYHDVVIGVIPLINFVNIFY
jgi:hypothetical protein